MLDKLIEDNNVKINSLLKLKFNQIDIIELISLIFTNIKYMNNKIEYEDIIIELTNVITKLERSQKEQNKKKTNFYLLKVTLLYNYFNYYFALEDNIKDNKNIAIRIDENLKTNYELLHKYMLFSYNSNEDINTLYEQTLLNKIEESSIKINDLIKKINTITKSAGEEFFKYCQELVDLAANIRNYATNEESLSIMFNYLYKGIYESSLKEKDKSKIYEMLSAEDAKGLDLIKNYRCFFDHAISKSENRLENVINNNLRVIGKKIPIKESDYFKLQLDTYEQIAIMLEAILNKLNS